MGPREGIRPSRILVNPLQSDLRPRKGRPRTDSREGTLRQGGWLEHRRRTDASHIGAVHVSEERRSGGTESLVQTLGMALP